MPTAITQQRILKDLGPVIAGGHNERVTTRYRHGTLHANHLACVVLDDVTGQVLPYRQLLSHPDYHEVWTTSSENEFGQLGPGF